MKPLKENLKNELAGRFDLEGSELTFLAGGREDSDGIVFTACKDGRKLVLKISQAQDEEYVKNILCGRMYVRVMREWDLRQKSILSLKCHPVILSKINGRK